MQQYSKYKPTAFDSAGAFLPDQQDWLVCPVGITRDTGGHDFALSNFRTLEHMLDELDPDGTDHEVCNFGHWGPGWFEIIIVRPDTACAKKAIEVEEALENYPVLDEEDYSRREHDTAVESWKWTDLEERVKACQYAGVSIFAARNADVMPQVEYESHSDGVYFRS